VEAVKPDLDRLAQLFHPQPAGEKPAPSEKVAPPLPEAQVSYYFYRSPLGGLKDVARLLDQCSRQTGVPYALTLFGGLSLHYEIKPFSIIHAYVRSSDLNLFKKRLKLKETPRQKANLCLMTTRQDVFRDARRMRNFAVVANDRLLQDLLAYSPETKVLAKEFARKGGETNGQ